ncbi:YfhO family protein [Diplocloster modestus]|uniref:YfhO family protein n=1 Tax=Diplocloster modestus TaxID=2850322 RepID=A0ABS6KAC9_9FIRM|nr:YfhO family protein [Diplocloster modestus]MBU9727452.1 YfhO family protein [Diplocloster modestus]
MTKPRIKQLIPYLLLATLALALVLLIWPAHSNYGSKMDWLSQHSVFPEYFRQLFYQTGNLFPDYAPELGGGQNIYYFAYYGLLNPLLLPSYLMPSVPMTDYIAVMAVLCVIASVCLFYYWLRSHTCAMLPRLTVSVLFLCASPVLFHSHRHIMFMDYMPFLLLALIGTDCYFRTGKRALVCISVFFCIMISYFFSVGCIGTILIYSLYLSYGQNTRLFSKETLRPLLHILPAILTAVLMAGVLLLPVAYVILNGRSGSGSLSFLSLLCPKFSIDWLLYSAYGTGLTCFSLAALLAACLSKNRPLRLLAVLLIFLQMIPLFVYLLNGTLYLRAKALIPFLPLYLLPALHLLQYLKSRLRRQSALCYLLILTSCITSLIVNHTETWAGQSITESLRLTEKEKLLSSLPVSVPCRTDDLDDNALTMNQTFGLKARRTSIYSSTSNKDYFHFLSECLGNAKPSRTSLISASTSNIFLQSLLGVRYLLCGNQVPAGCLPLQTEGSTTLYENGNARPLAYATNCLYSESSYKALRFPYTLQPLFEGIITQHASQDVPSITESWLTPLSLPSITEPDNLHITQSSGSLKIEAADNATAVLPLDTPLTDQILILEFQVDDTLNPPTFDTSVTVNGIQNKLSKKTASYPNHNDQFRYVISSDTPITHLDLCFSPGTYTLSSIQAYTVNTAAFQSAVTSVIPLIPDAALSGSLPILQGTIDLPADSYLATTLPYDQGYTVTVDGRPQPYEKVNTAFVGLPLTKGFHKITITYQAPFKLLGLICSLLGFLLFFTLLRPWRRRFNRDRTGF